MDRTARSLFLAILAIVLSFTAATIFTNLRATEVDELARNIAEDTSPSIQELSEARQEIRHLQVLLERYVAEDATLDGAASRRAAIDQARTSYADHIEQYLQLPIFPGEREIWHAVSEELRAFEDSVARVLTLTDLQQSPAARTVLTSEVAPQADRASVGILRSIDFNARMAGEAATKIRHTRSQMARIAVALDIVCAAVACWAAAIVFRTFRRYTSLLEAKQAELTRRNDELEQFAGRVAHDIVSPLTTVSMALDFGDRRARETGQQVSLFAAGKRSIARVQRVVDGLLEFARAGARPGPDARASLEEVLEDVVAGTSPAATSAGIELRTEGRLDVMLRCSPGALTSVLSNLINNAIKYMGEASVRRIVVQSRQVGPNMRIEVVDTGPGLAPDLEREVFEPYVRGVGSNQPGIGLGLATVRRIVRSHGGSLGVDSQPGSGCCFWFELPTVAAEHDPAGQPSAGRTSPEPSPEEPHTSAQRSPAEQRGGPVHGVSSIQLRAPAPGERPHGSRRDATRSGR